MDMAIANTILAQMGGNKLLAMTGATPMTADRGLNLRLRSNPNRVTSVVIRLQDNDLYRVQSIRIRGVQINTLADLADVEAAKLRETFEILTGLYTSLAT